MSPQKVSITLWRLLRILRGSRARRNSSMNCEVWVSESPGRALWSSPGSPESRVKKRVVLRLVPEHLAVGDSVLIVAGSLGRLVRVVSVRSVVPWSVVVARSMFVVVAISGTSSRTTAPIRTAAEGRGMFREFESGKTEDDIRSGTVREIGGRQREEGEAPPLGPLPEQEVQGVVWPSLRRFPSRRWDPLVSSPARGRFGSVSDSVREASESSATIRFRGSSGLVRSVGGRRW